MTRGSGQKIEQHRIIGVPVERVDGVEMVSGNSVYAVGVKLPGMLWGEILCSLIAHGSVLRVDME